MKELINFFVSTETGKAAISAMIGAFVAIFSILIKDFILYEFRERRKEKKALIDRKLTQLYGPIYMVCVTGESSISRLLSNDDIYNKLIPNMHLLSPKLQHLFNKYNRLGTGDFRCPQFKKENKVEAAEISKEFASILEKEMYELRKYYK